MTTPLSLSARLAGIVRDALAVLARLGPSGAVSGPVLVAIWTSLQNRLRRFERLMARVAAGRPAIVRRKPIRHEPTGPRKRTPPRATLVPRGYGWAVKLAQETAVFGSQLQALLSEPDLMALLQTTPEAAPILRPLCRMLAMDLPAALLPPGAKPRQEKAWRPPRPGQFPGGENWPGFRVWRERWEAANAAARARQAKPRPPWRGWRA